MKYLMIFALSLLVFSSTGQTSSPDDDEVKASLVYSVGFKHSAARNQFQSSIIRCCDYDTNRFLRLVKEVAHEKANCTWSMLLLVGKYGSANDLDFVSEYLTSPSFGPAATEAFCCIEGVSSNSVTASAQFLSPDVAADYHSKVVELRWFLKRFSGSSSPNDVRAYAFQTCLQFAMSATNELPGIDRYINAYYPSYSNSVERLAILTNAVARGVNEYELRYMTNAIHHIELPCLQTE